MAGLAAAIAGPSSGASFEHRWFYLSTNLQVEDNAARAAALIRRAAKAGYNGVLLSDYKFGFLGDVPDFYFDHARRVIAAARGAGLSIYPAVAPMGYSGSLLKHDPNLAEGLPVRGAVFTVRGDEAVHAPEPPVAWRNGGFEEAEGDRATGWTFQDSPGSASFIDRRTAHGGRASLRFEGVGAADPRHGHGRIMQEIDVAPFRQYHLAAWIRTRGFSRADAIKATVIAVEDGRVLTFNEWGVRTDQEWTEHHAVFNSLASRRVRVYLGVWGGAGGAFWLDDVSVREVGLLNVLRRPGCPLLVMDARGRRLREGTDFEPVLDPRMGTVPWPGSYEVFHAPPSIRLTRRAGLKEGDRLTAGFFHAVQVYDGQVAACLTASRVHELIRDQVRRVRDLFDPPGFFMSHDEIRVAGWCEDCRRTGKTPGELLADNVRRCAATVREEAPGAEVFVWSDMFDPHHNARDGYYLVNGTLEGSWEGLDRDVIVANWNFGGRRDSLPWFAGRGHRQLLAGYYDGEPERIGAWLAGARGIERVDGVMYTTWRGDYDDLEAFAEAAWGGR